MRGVKTKILKTLPNKQDIKFNPNHFEIDGVEYILWDIRREGKTIWIRMEDNSPFGVSMCGTYYTSYDDIPPKLYPYIMKYLKGIIF